MSAKNYVPPTIIYPGSFQSVRKSEFAAADLFYTNGRSSLIDFEGESGRAVMRKFLNALLTATELSSYKEDAYDRANGVHEPDSELIATEDEFFYSLVPAKGAVSQLKIMNDQRSRKPTFLIWVGVIVALALIGTVIGELRAG